MESNKKIWKYICDLWKRWISQRHQRKQREPFHEGHNDEHQTENESTPPKVKGVLTASPSSKDKDPNFPEPKKYGSRRRPNPRTPVVERRKFNPRPELVCRYLEEEWQWDIILSAREVPDIVAVQHNGEPLSDSEGEYRISNFSGKLVIEYSNGRENEEIPLFDKNEPEPLIFKMKKDWVGDGRNLVSGTQGHFIMFAPREWKQTGHIPRERQQCADGKFSAYYFYKDKDDGDGEIGGFEKYKNIWTKSKFTLCGKHLIDASKDGKLFIGNPPHLELEADITWVRVGEEKPEGWKGANFKPSDKTLAEILDGRQGRFFIRIYNDTTTLIDSGEFRYYADLREIKVNGQPYSQNELLFPPPRGYAAVALQFIGVDGENIAPEIKTEQARLERDKTVTIAPHPEGDEIVFILSSEAGSVDIVIKLPRIWWQLAQDVESSGTWLDKPLKLTREKFHELAQEQYKINFRLPFGIRNAYVDFDDNLSSYRTISDGLQLNDFIDYEIISEPLEKDAALRVQFQDGESPITLIRIVADRPTSPQIRTQSKPYAQVKKSKGRCFRRGKGFSIAEVQGAGLCKDEAVRCGVGVDNRRKSQHQINIDTLNKVKDHA